MPKQIPCPKCGATIRVEKRPDLERVECPACSRSFKVKRGSRTNSGKQARAPGQESSAATPSPAEPRQARPDPPAAKETDDAYAVAPDPADAAKSEDAFGVAPEPADITDTGASADVFSVAPEVTDAHQVPAAVPDFATGGSASGESPSPAAPASRPHPAQRKQAKTGKGEPGNRKLIIWCAGGGALALALLVTVGLLLFGGGGGSADGQAPGISEELAEAIGLDDGEFVVISQAPSSEQRPTSQDPRLQARLSLADTDRAQAIGPGGSLESPGEWKPLPTLTAASEIQLRPVSAVPVAYNREHYIMLSVLRSPTPPSREAPEFERNRPVSRDLYWRKFSWETGKPVGPPRWLASQQVPPQDRPVKLVPYAPLVAALSPGGTHFAAEDIARPGSVRIWPGEAAPFELAVADDGAPLRWIDWNAAGQLLTLAADGKLTCWEAADSSDAKPLWTVQGDESSFVTWAPARKWLALGATAVVHLVDPESGEQLGQLHYESELPLRDVAVSPDGRRLAAIYIPATDKVPNIRDRSDDVIEADLIVWNLKSATAQTAGLPMDVLSVTEQQRQRVCYRSVRWITPDRLVIDRVKISSALLRRGSVPSSARPRNCVYDVTTGELLAAVQSEADVSDGRSEVLYFDARGQGWSSDGRAYCPVTFLDPELEEHEFVFSDSPLQQPSAAPKLQIAVDAGTKALSRKRGEAAAAYLAQQGIAIGPGGYTLRVRFEAFDDDDEQPEEFAEHELVRMTQEGVSQLTTPGGKWPAPSIKGSWRLFDAEGKELWKVATQEYWRGHASKYISKREHGDFIGGWLSTNYTFDFGDKGAREAISEEIFQQNDGNPKSALYDLPAVLLAGGEFQVDEPIKSALVDLERADASSKERKAAIGVIGDNLLKMRLHHRHRQALIDIVNEQDDPSVVAQQLRVLKSKQEREDTRPQVVRYARFKAADFPSGIVDDAERQPPPLVDLGLRAALKHTPPLLTGEYQYGSLDPPIVRYSPDGETWRVLARGAVAKFDCAENKLLEAVRVDLNAIRDPIVAVSPDFEWVGCTSRNVVTVVNVANPARQWSAPLEGRGGAFGMAFAPDGRRVVSFLYDSARVWDYISGDLVAEWEGPMRGQACQFSPDGSLVVLPYESGLQFFDTNKFEPAGRIELDEPMRVRRIVFSADSSTIAWFGDLDYKSVYVRRITRDADGKVAADGEIARYYHPGEVAAVALNSDGSQVASAGFVVRKPDLSGAPTQTRIDIWETASGRSLRRICLADEWVAERLHDFRPMTRAREVPIQLTFSPGGDELAVSTAAGRVLLLDVGSTQDELLANRGEVQQIEFEAPSASESPSSPAAAVDYTESPAFLGAIELPESGFVNSYYRNVTFGPQNQRVRVFTGGEFLIYDWESRELIDTIAPPAQANAGVTAHLRAVVSPDSKVAAFPDADANVVLVRDGKSRLLRVPAPNDRYHSQHLLDFSPEGDRLFTWANLDGKNLVEWDVQRGRVVREHLAKGHIDGGRFARGGELIVACFQETVTVWDGNRFEPHVQLKVPPTSSGQRLLVKGFSVAENGTAFAGVTRQHCVVWRHEDGLDALEADAAPTIVAEPGPPNISIALDATGRFLLTGFEGPLRPGADDLERRRGRPRIAQAALRLRDLDSRQIVLEVTDLAKGTDYDFSRIRLGLSPDGRRVAALVADKLLMFERGDASR